MPIYEFLCSDCGRTWEILLSPRETELAACPECGSRNAKRLLSVPAPTGVGKGMPTAAADRCCGTAGPPSSCGGPGSCCGKR